ncbi:hypothetical protein AC579_24 [Pseudocercospora musae]|uniref:Uncharacterized protein n=1 Tax=Pseudocercospora musae TaxID=113226 RepID=A0A139I0C5_9PEZI|nr:hypothetical protein AC579_24 [Pseudocercospora musae]
MLPFALVTSDADDIMASGNAELYQSGSESFYSRPKDESPFDYLIRHRCTNLSLTIINIGKISRQHNVHAPSNKQGRNPPPNTNSFTAIAVISWDNSLPKKEILHLERVGRGMSILIVRPLRVPTISQSTMQASRRLCMLFPRPYRLL